MWSFRRLRGALLRMAYDRRAAVGLGLLLIAPAVWASVFDRPWESRATTGLVFIAAATGVALVITGVSGRRSDWIDPDRK